jgi:hypothetical protein
MECKEKQKLLGDYQSATVQFAAAVDRLHCWRATSAREEYEEFRRASEDARLVSEKARLALEEHVSSHGC